MKSQAPSADEINRGLYGGHKKRLAIESQLVRSVLDYLGAIGFRAFRRNIGARDWIDATGKHRLMRFGEPGQSDVWAIGPNGIHIEIECKRQKAGPRLGLTLEQQAWLADVRATGAIAMCVCSLEELAVRLRDEFLKRGLEWRRGWML